MTRNILTESSSITDDSSKKIDEIDRVTFFFAMFNTFLPGLLSQLPSDSSSIFENEFKTSNQHSRKKFIMNIPVTDSAGLFILGNDESVRARASSGIQSR